MKVWLISYSEIVTKGSNPRLLGYYTHLQKQGHHPCFWFLKGKLPEHSPYNAHVASRINVPLFSLVLNRLVLKLLFFKPVDRVYIYSPNVLFLPVYLACKIRGIQIIIEKTELDSIKPYENSKDLINRWLYKIDEILLPWFADKLVVISQRLLDYYSTKKVPIKLIGTFIPYHVLESIKPIAPNRSQFVVGYMGSFGQKDDMETLVEAFKLFHKKHPDSQLKAIGKHPQSFDFDIGLNPGLISLTGELPANEMASELASCDVLVAIRKDHDYSDFGFPSKLSEYMSTGKPVICSESSDIPALLKDDQHVLMIEPESVKQLINALDWIKSNPIMAQTIGNSGKDWALSHWNPETVLSEWSSWVQEA